MSLPMFLRSIMIVMLVGFATTALAQEPDFCVTAEQTRQAGLRNIDTNCLRGNNVDSLSCFNAARAFVRTHEALFRARSEALSKCSNLDRTTLRADLVRARSIVRGMSSHAILDKDGKWKSLAAEQLASDRVYRLGYNYFRTSVCVTLFNYFALETGQAWRSVSGNYAPIQEGNARQLWLGPSSDPNACGVITLGMVTPDLGFWMEPPKLRQLTLKIEEVWGAAAKNIRHEAIYVGMSVLPGGVRSYLKDAASRIDNLVEELHREISGHVEASGLGWQVLVARGEPRLVYIPDASGPDLQLLKQYPDVEKAYAEFSKWLDASIPR